MHCIVSICSIHVLTVHLHPLHNWVQEGNLRKTMRRAACNKAPCQRGPSSRLPLKIDFFSWTFFAGIAVDWLGRNIYWTDSRLDAVQVAKLNGSQKRTLVSSNLGNPRAIIVDPPNGYDSYFTWNNGGPSYEREWRRLERGRWGGGRVERGHRVLLTLMAEG